MMKKYAIFLPQFHEIDENNAWWGKGFTEWTTVKKAKPLFNGHEQPKEPLNNNYYNLLDPATVKWQNELLKKYHIDGLAYYHYYFCGKKLLEKPAENLLKWKDIDQHFFFFWANHTWRRTWEGKTTVLIEQIYGEQTDWEKHFQYLLQFFKDPRYEKINGKPIFAIYNSFLQENDMLSYFDRRCKEEGFEGIHIIKNHKYMSIDQEKLKINDENTVGRYSQSICVRLPEAYMKHYFVSQSLINHFTGAIRRRIAKNFKIGGFIEKIDGNRMIDDLISMNYLDNDDIIPTVIFGWDNTPRHQYRGYVITPPDKKHFFLYMNKIKSCNCVLFNAWNEWSEGMILEPTKTNRYMYLEWIKEWTENYENN